MSHLKAKMHQIRFPASVRPSVRLLDGVWHLHCHTTHLTLHETTRWRRQLLQINPNFTWLGHGTFDVSSSCILAVSSLHGPIRSTRRARLARHVECVVSCRDDVTSRVEFGL